MRIRVESNGKVAGTRVYDADTGEKLYATVVVYEVVSAGDRGIVRTSRWEVVVDTEQQQ